MKTQQLTQQLTREIKRNPAKAAVLGGLLVVAVWFWFPLLKGWFGSPPSAASAKSEASIVVPQTDLAAGTTSVTVATPEPTNWQTIAERISADPWMKPGTLRSETFDPFFPEQPQETQLTSTDAPAETTAAPDVSPETAGLVVTSVIVGGSQPIARINRMNYHVGDQVAADDGQVVFTLREVNQWGVVLQGNYRSYELHLEHTPLTSRHRMVMRNGTVISPDN